ncbi:DUF4209 domain-containing protein [Photobacterium angustum]|uniref:DUF4209 domain-containing protein n=1 Tax=Photobacterium angustum TaxID=661 RepID=UPI0005E30229|nr:DUF4209 domain-containing protein [Photobacterium angustum]KJG29178.1 hypothetical protein UA69_15055 [Photobacterium angustum]PSW91430.1 DUF4209 domain-containing protein [Photobacterium angustum]
MEKVDLYTNVRDIITNIKRYDLCEWEVSNNIAELRINKEHLLTPEQLIIIDGIIFLLSHKINNENTSLQYINNWKFAKLNENNVETLEKFIISLNSSWLNAKFYDIVSTTMRISGNKNYLQNCIEEYISLPLNKIFDCIVYWERVLFLTDVCNLKAYKEQIKEILINEANNNNDTYIIAKILNEHNLLRNDYREISLNLKSKINDVIDKEGHLIAVLYWDLIIDITKKNRGKKHELDEYILSKIETIIEYADLNRKNNIIVAIEYYRESVIELKSHKFLSDIKNKVLYLETKLSELRIESVANFNSGDDITRSIDISEELKIIDQLIIGETLMEFTLIPDREYHDFIRIEKKLKYDNCYSELINTSTYIDTDGRKLGSVDNNSEEGKRIKLYRLFMEHTSDLAVRFILPTLKKFKSRSKLSIKDFEIISKSCPFIPENQKMIMANALWYGYNEDFSTSLMLITPLVENILRNILKESNTSTIDIGKEHESEKSINKLLKISKEHEILNKGVIFKIQAIFSERFGLNYRNKIAHGLLSYENSNSLHSIYVWWLALKWILIYSDNSSINKKEL